MKKVGILTYHNGFNYGACLQAYALQHVLERYDVDCTIINYEPIDFLASREMFSRRPFKLKEIVKVVTRTPYYKSLKNRERLFREYNDNCLKTTKLLRTREEVIAEAAKYEAVFCGSDQIWNLGKKAGPAANTIYFMDFPKKQKRIAYAASFGSWVKEADSREEDILPWLKQFDKISVRENSGVEYLQSKGIDCIQTLDPTVLLDADEYNSICAEPIIDGKYILMFGWNVNADLIGVAKAVAKKFNLPVYNIVPPPRGLMSGIKRELAIGPCEFLSMVKNASFIVTNSFHGTAFSTTFEKPFVSVVTGKADVRMESLLRQLGLSDCLLEKDDIDFDKLMDIDYSDVMEKKRLLRNDSLNFIEKAVKDII